MFISLIFLGWLKPITFLYFIRLSLPEIVNANVDLFSPFEQEYSLNLVTLFGSIP